VNGCAVAEMSLFRVWRTEEEGQVESSRDQVVAVRHDVLLIGWEPFAVEIGSVGAPQVDHGQVDALSPK
jgi:hypothetical protein